jgi:polar amino acid transport system permease protein
VTDFSLWDIALALLAAARWTVLLSVIAFVAGGLMGFVFLMVRVSRRRWLRAVGGAYIELFQGTPLLAQLFLAFFGLPLIGIETSALTAAGLALTLWSTAFLAEIWRACVEAIPRAQWEASASLGMTYPQQMLHVILPQVVRIAIPPTVGFAVQVVKGTALASVIGFVELSRASTIIANASFQPLTAYGFAAILYFVLCWPLSKASRLLEKRLDVARRS